MGERRAPGALEGVRVIDLAGAAGNYCGKMFAELGADVILVEPKQGSELRHMPPFVDGEPEQSLPFFANNTSKRSIVLDIETEAARGVLRKLLKTAALLIESERPGRLVELGLGYEDLQRVNPALVVTSITPFGQTGPYAAYPASDLTCQALGGFMSLSGYADGPPVQPGGDQAYAAGNMFAAVASLLAVTHAELTGKGQHVDVSIQECVAMALENAVQFYDLEGTVRRRWGGQQKTTAYGVFECADGYVFLQAAGFGETRHWQNLLAWLKHEEIEGVDRLEGPAWEDRDYFNTDEAKQTLASVVTPFFRSRGKQDLYHEAQRWRVPFAPVNSPREVVESPQLKARDFWAETPGLGRDRVKVPGAPYKLSDTPWSLAGPAPELGADTAEILHELGVSSDEVAELTRQGLA
nr:CaiB/BaiF CoA-transferase family protein [Nocardioides luti]